MAIDAIRGVRRRDVMGYFALAVGLTTALAVAPAAPAKADTVIVKIDNFTFAPAMLTVKSGTTVKFENHDDIPHSIVDAAGKFRSKALDTDNSFSFTFTTAGEYLYFCSLHPHMTGTIKVE